jgi:hypothetical protein
MNDKIATAYDQSEVAGSDEILLSTEKMTAYFLTVIDLPSAAGVTFVSRGRRGCVPGASAERHHPRPQGQVPFP